METIRASVLARFFGPSGGQVGSAAAPKIRVKGVQSECESNQKVLEITEVTIKTVEKDKYLEACRHLTYGEVISTSASTQNFAIADHIHMVPVDVKGVQIGKLHLRFYKEQKKVKRNFVAYDNQVRKLLCKKRDLFALQMADWLGDSSEENLANIAAQACREIEQLCIRKPTSGKAASVNAEVVKANVVQVPDTPKAEKSVEFNQQYDTAKSLKVASDNAVATLQSAVDRKAKGVRWKGVVVETGTTLRAGRAGQGPYRSFCLKLDVDGSHVPFYGVELERECAERGVKAGQLVEIIDMGKQDLGNGKHRNLYNVKILKS